MSGYSVEEIGVKLSMIGRSGFIKDLQAANKELGGIGTTAAKTGEAMKTASANATAAAKELATATTAAADAQRALDEAVISGTPVMDAAGNSAWAAAAANKALADANLAAARDAGIAADAQVGAAAKNDAAVASRSAVMGSLAAVGKKATLGIVGVAGVLGFEGVKNVAKFSDQFTRLYTLANVSKGSLGALTNWAVTNSPRLLEPVTTIADQMYRIASSSPGIQYTTRQLEAMTTAAAKLSVLGGPLADPEQTARVFGIVKAAGGLGMGTNYNKIGATAAATVGAGDMTMPDLISALGSGGLVEAANQYKVTMPQIGAVLAQLGDVGITGSQAGHALTHALALMGAPASGPAKQTYAAIGLQPASVGMAFRTKGLESGLGMLTSHLAGPLGASGSALVNQLLGQSLTPAQSKMLLSMGLKVPSQTAMTAAQSSQAATQGLGSMGAFGQQLQTMLMVKMFGGAKQSVPVVAALTGLTRINAKLGEITSNADQYGKKVSAAFNTPASVFRRWSLDIKQLENKMGMALIPVILRVGKAIKDGVKWLERHRGAAIALAAAIGGPLVVAIGLWVLAMVPAAIQMAIILAPFIAIGVVAGGLAYGIYQLATHWSQAWSWIKAAFRDAVDWITSPQGIGILVGILGPAGALLVAGAELVKHWKGIWAGIKGIFQIGVNDVIRVIDVFISALNILPGVNIKQIGLINLSSTPPKTALPGAASAAAIAKLNSVGVGGTAPSASLSTVPTSASANILTGASKMAAGGSLGVGAGFMTNGPRAIVGEGRARFPEFVIPTDPLHRDNALALFRALGTHLMADGGVLSGIEAGLSAVPGLGWVGKATLKVASQALGPLVAAADQMANLIPAGIFRNMALGAINTIASVASSFMQSGSASTATAPGSAAANAPVSISGNVALGRRLAGPYGWATGAEWNSLYALWQRESGWSNTAVNPSSGAAGIAQSLGHGYVNLADPTGQIAWGLDYIKGRYGDPVGAWGHETQMGWYEKGGILARLGIPVQSLDQGGHLPPGLSAVWNGIGAPEAVPGPNAGHGSQQALEGVVVKLYLDPAGRKLLAQGTLDELATTMARR